ncbi:MAG: crotonase/enoyl-CoA hydratase family protein [Acidimicrobiales bacterium]
MKVEEFHSTVLTIERRGHVSILWLDRPEARNAMGDTFWSDLPVAMACLSQDPEVRVVVVGGRGPHFSVGLDLKSLSSAITTGQSGPRLSSAARSAEIKKMIQFMQAAITSVADCPKPVIAAVHGYCIGGGIDLITACDIRIASSDAILSVRETKMAIVADLGTLQRLPLIVGRGHLFELVFSGRDIDASRARQIGLVNAVSQDAKSVIEDAIELANDIASNSPLAVQGAKAVLTAQTASAVSDGLDYVANWNAGMLISDDLMEAISAFMEKRPPDFNGR